MVFLSSIFTGLRDFLPRNFHPEWILLINPEVFLYCSPLEFGGFSLTVLIYDLSIFPSQGQDVFSMKA